MKIQIEKQIEVLTDRTIEGFNAIIEASLRYNEFREVENIIKYDTRITNFDFFIYYGGSHIAVHEILPNGEKSERLLLIS